MALFNEVSSDVLAGILAADEENRKRRLMEDYNQEKANLDTKYSSNKGGLGGFLGGIVGGIGKGIGDLGTALYDMGGTAIAGLTGGVEGADNFKKNLYKTDSIKDAYAKSSGTALNAASTLATTVLPIGAAGGTAAKALGGTVANAGAGAIGGIADELQQNGENFNAESAANRAISGAAAGLVGGKVGSKIGNASSKIGGALLNNRLATSAVGRGAIAGAVGGATGAGTSAALSGGDIVDSTLQGALGGAMTGAAQGGLMSAGNRVGQRIKNDRGIGTPETAATSVAETNPATDGFMAYGESQLAKRTRGGQAAEALRNFGQTLEGSQTNITRPAANDLGIESTGKVVDNVRKKTGITNLDTQAQLAKELTGGENSLMDMIQKNALSATEDGTGKYLADHTKILDEVDGIVDRYGLTSSLKGSGIETIKDEIRSDILNPKQDLLTKSNNFKALAQELRGKGVVSPTAGDKARAQIYSDVAKSLDDLSYSAIPKENVNDMFDVTISEMKARANQAANNGNKDIANAYNNLAESLNKQPRTIQAYRNFKKDFVDISKIYKLTAQAENGAAQNMGNTAAGIKKKISNLILGNASNKGLARAGGALNKIADTIDVNTSRNNSTIKSPVQPLDNNVLNPLTNYVARTAGNIQANDNLNELERTQDYKNLEDLLSANAAALNAEYGPQLQALQPTAQQNQSTAQLAQISNGMNQALAAGDLKAYSQLADLYKTAYQIYEAQNPTQKQEKLSKTQQQANAAELALNELEQMTPDAGYAVKDIPLLNLVNVRGNKYASTADSLAMQIGYMMSGANIKEDEAKKIGDAYVPQPFDDEATRRYKLNQARAIISQYKNGVNTDSES